MTEAIRAALFIDFDNVYLSLDRFDRRAAKAFAERPAMWLDWLEAGRHDVAEDGTTTQRRVLIRNCYLNPAAFGAQRAFFTRAAFSVVDCPALTARGKNSADILMVMDMLDAIQHPTRFDEFIVLSSDADFTPVLLRLRAHDRRTAVLTGAVTAAAFREACDVSIDLETFAVEALGLDPEERRLPRSNEGQAAQADFAGARARAASLLLEEVRRIGPIPAQEVYRVFTRMDAFQDSSWFGMGSLKTLLEDLVRLETDLMLELDGSLPAAVRLRGPGDPTPAPPPKKPSAPAAPAAVAPAAPASRPDSGLARFVDNAYVLVGAPKLATETYDRLFQALAEASARDRASPDQLLAAAAARPPKGPGVSRRDASFVIDSLAEAGALDRPTTAAALARGFRDALQAALANAGHTLDDEDRAKLDAWLLREEDAA